MMDIPRKRASIPPTCNIRKNLYSKIEKYSELSDPSASESCKVEKILRLQFDLHKFSAFSYSMNFKIVVRTSATS